MSRGIDPLRCSRSRRHAEPSRFGSKRFPRGRFTGHPDLPPPERFLLSTFGHVPGKLVPGTPVKFPLFSAIAEPIPPQRCVSREEQCVRVVAMRTLRRGAGEKDQSAASLFPPHEALIRQTSDCPSAFRKQPITALLLVAHPPRVGPLSLMDHEGCRRRTTAVHRCTETPKIGQRVTNSLLHNEELQGVGRKKFSAPCNYLR